MKNGKSNPTVKKSKPCSRSVIILPQHSAFHFSVVYRVKYSYVAAKNHIIFSDAYVKHSELLFRHANRTGKR